ncbi:unnamed protein product [Closterium sp. Naga37s-1]|nr:unnamed protein product [Closterium sp. Naga37s-1]
MAPADGSPAADPAVKPSTASAEETIPTNGSAKNGNGRAATSATPAATYVGSLCQLSAPLPTKVALVNADQLVESPEEEAECETLEQAVLSALDALPKDIDRYMYLRATREADEELFFRLLMDHTEEVLPYIYTPTVGEACQRYHELGIVPNGIYLTAADKGHFLERLRAACPHSGIRVIVVTDGERILGLGDQGAGGMGISEGKILLYTAMAGLDPRRALPVMLDVGTNNEKLLSDPGYKGLRQRRMRGPEYDELVDELMTAARTLKPHVLLQFEDFGNCNAFRLLECYQHTQCCFNDDIQGTACITLAGLLSALRVTGRPLEEQRILFLGAGEAGTGIAQLIAQAMNRRCGMDIDAARQRCLFIDSKGLVCKERELKGELQDHKIPFAHDLPYQPDLISAVHEFRPTVLVGVSAQANAFSKEVVEAMGVYNDRPVIFPLSNPTSKAECSYKEAFKYTGGRVVFASGSPFPPLVAESAEPGGGKVTMYPAQANNAYVFGPIGMAALLTRCSSITDDVFLSTAEFLAQLTPQAHLDRGMLFPSLSAMKALVPLLIARISEFMVAEGLGTPPPAVGAGTVAEWERHARASMYHPHPHGPLALPAVPSDSEELQGWAGAGAGTGAGAGAGAAQAEQSQLQDVVHQHLHMPGGPEVEVSAGDMEELADMCRDFQQYLLDRRLKENGVAVFIKPSALPAAAGAANGVAAAGAGLKEMRGVYLTGKDRGQMLPRLQRWGEQRAEVGKDVDAVLVVDAEIVLGHTGNSSSSGNSNGNGASNDSMATLFSSAAAAWPNLDPSRCLLVCLDTGTDNPELLAAGSGYRGLSHPRLKPSRYNDILAELLGAVRVWNPSLLLQFTDFYNSNAFKLLDKYRGTHCCYESTTTSSDSGEEEEGEESSSESDNEVAAAGAGGWGGSVGEGVGGEGVGEYVVPQVPVCCVSLDGMLSALEEADGVVAEFGVAFMEDAADGEPRGVVTKGKSTTNGVATSGNGAAGVGGETADLVGLQDVKECTLDGGNNDLICTGSLTSPSGPSTRKTQYKTRAVPHRVAIPSSLPYCTPFAHSRSLAAPTLRLSLPGARVGGFRASAAGSVKAGASVARVAGLGVGLRFAFA